MKRAHNHDFELNLTPIIDCFVTLICFLLLSATYVNLVGMEAKVPIAVPASSPQAKKEQPFKLEVDLKKNSIMLTATGAGKATGKKTIALSSTQNEAQFMGALEQLHVELVKVKRERPKEFTLNFTSDVELPYEQLVRIMDATRNLDAKKDGLLAVTDERNGQPVKIDLLFPDFVLGGLTPK